ncbi:o-succinylbenzoate--CoA ligase [Jeotgalibacillus aurantiacus]|uniref:o-succinylbenzoate--CoA ligase n=1 Tax=Jeotgalibacillus aurantiacus TaxID=2763266 RepID=UPI001D09D359|nr:o-succinylbenzoate--CoA ligase [Jeotgalibacillus aurantiacus]
MSTWLEKRAYLTPNRVALYFADQTWTFKDLETASQAFAARLSGFIDSTDPVALLLQNHPDTVIAIHAIQKLELPVLMLNSRLTAEEWNFQLQDSGAQLVITDHHSVPDLDADVITADEVKLADPVDLTTWGHAELCSIMYTSGTTGHPKGVMQSYDNHFASASASAFNIGLDTKDIWMCAVPLFHISGFSILMRSVIYGIGVRLYAKFDERVIHQDLASGKGTILSVVSVMLQRLLDVKDSAYHASFRCMLLGGGPAPESMVEKCHQLNIPVFQSYGMTETCSQFTTLSPEDAPFKIGSSGKPLFPGELKIVTESGETVTQNEIGEIALTGPSVTSGYFHNREATDKALQRGWFRTGDLGYLDPDGFLYVVDRRSDLIISGGENVYPAEIESVLMSHPAVREAGVAGKKDREWGEVPVAFVVTDQPCTEEELLNYCRERLAAYKTPKNINFTDSLPRNAGGKLIRRFLKEEVNADNEHR